MPINRKEKIAFIHIPKNAGSSIEQSLNILPLNPHEYDKDILYGFDENNFVLQTLPVCYMKEYVDLTDYKIFCVVRNPYDRLLSDYCWRDRGCESFGEFIKLVETTLKEKTEEELLKFDRNSHCNHFLPQHRYISDEYKIAILRFETIERDFKEIFKKSIPHVNKTKHKFWREYYNDENIKIVNNLYKEDFDKFGYEMIKPKIIEMKVNYVIATYAGINKRIHTWPKKENVLTEHLDLAVKFKSQNTEITVMKAKCEGKIMENYYKNESRANNIVDCENYGFSMGQWLKSYEIYREKFDYYIFIEDDYCPNKDKFDEYLIKKYNQNFPDKIGLLCGLVQGSNKKGSKFPIHFEGVVILSKETLSELYGCYKWKGEPRTYLDRIGRNYVSSFDWEHIRKLYIGAYYQLSFSQLFNLIGIEHKDYLEKNTLFPYWSDEKGIIFYEKGDKISSKFSLEDIKKSVILPIQLIKERYIKHNIK